MNKITIILSTHNGAAYLQSQLDSLTSQSIKEFSIIARDDGSIDNSCEIFQNFMKHSSLDAIILEEKTNLGVKKSFELLMHKALLFDTHYIIFADQDDVWDSEKVEKTYLKMQELEHIYGLTTPVLVHSDLTVVDASLNVLASSFWQYQHIDSSKDSLYHFLLNNIVTGCTMMINRALAEKIKTIPTEAIMHDWWIAMVASVFGKIGYINEPLILYRQHGDNNTGATQYGFQYFVKKFFAKPSFRKYINQSKAFLELYSKELNENDRKMLEEFSSFGELTKCQKLKILYKYKIWKNGFMRNLGLIFFA